MLLWIVVRAVQHVLLDLANVPRVKLERPSRCERHGANAWECKINAASEEASRSKAAFPNSTIAAIASAGPTG